MAARQVGKRLVEAHAARHVLQDGAEAVHAVGPAERHARGLSVAQLVQHLLAEERREEWEAPHALGRRREEAAQLALIHLATHSRRPLQSRHGAEQSRIDERLGGGFEVKQLGMQHTPLSTRCSEQLSMLLPPLGALELGVLCAAVVLNRHGLRHQPCARQV